MSDIFAAGSALYDVEVESFIGKCRRYLAPAIGLFLVAAALIKIISPADSAQLEMAYKSPRWLVVAAVQLELVIGLWLLSGWQAGLARRTAIALVLVFSVFSIYLAFAGYASCGCFGSVRVNPWLTFTLDIGILGALTYVCPGSREKRVAGLGNNKSWYFLGALTLVSGTSLALIAALIPPDSSEAGTPGVVASGSLMILKPEKWVGRPFPLIKELSPTVDLHAGRWIALFYHHDCPNCQLALPKYEALSEHLAEEGTVRVVLIEVPPFGAERPLASIVTAHARLDSDQEWLVQTPLEVVVEEGKVLAASTDLMAVSSSH